MFSSLFRMFLTLSRKFTSAYFSAIIKRNKISNLYMREKGGR